MNWGDFSLGLLVGIVSTFVLLGLLSYVVGRLVDEDEGVKRC